MVYIATYLGKNTNSKLEDKCDNSFPSTNHDEHSLVIHSNT